MGRHKYTKKWIEEYRQDPGAFDMPADDPVLQSTPPRTPKKTEATAERIKAEPIVPEEVISPRLYGGQGRKTRHNFCYFSRFRTLYRGLPSVRNHEHYFIRPYVSET